MWLCINKTVGTVRTINNVYNDNDNTLNRIFTQIMFLQLMNSRCHKVLNTTIDLFVTIK